MNCSKLVDAPFQLTAARRRLVKPQYNGTAWQLFQLTAARRRLGPLKRFTPMIWPCCFNSQPPEGGWVLNLKFFTSLAAFQLTAARRRLAGFLTITICALNQFQLTAARRRLGDIRNARWYLTMFQLTAARRRLDFSGAFPICSTFVSTHSRPKAAGPLV